VSAWQTAITDLVYSVEYSAFELSLHVLLFFMYCKLWLVAVALFVVIHLCFVFLGGVAGLQNMMKKFQQGASGKPGGMF
jgi:hypothetical protein